MESRSTAQGQGELAGATPSFDEAALVVLREGLLLIATRRTGDAEAARDAAQETMVRVLAAIRDGRVTQQAQLGPFAYGVLRHVLVDGHRQRVREEPLDMHELPSAAPDALAQLVTRERAARVGRALAQLGAADRELLERCFVDGRRVSDIARETGEPEGRLRQRKLRALMRLRVALGNELPGNTTE